MRTRELLTATENDNDGISHRQRFLKSKLTIFASGSCLYI